LKINSPRSRNDLNHQKVREALQDEGPNWRSERGRVNGSR
jgi:hypothetical protein